MWMYTFYNTIYNSDKGDHINIQTLEMVMNNILVEWNIRYEKLHLQVVNHQILS